MSDLYFSTRQLPHSDPSSLSKPIRDSNTVISSEQQKMNFIQASEAVRVIGSVVSTSTHSPPTKTQHGMISMERRGSAGGGKSPQWQPPSVGVDAGRSLGDLWGGCSGGDAQSEQGLIVLFVCSLHVFLPAPLRKNPQAPWPLNPQRWGPGGDKGRVEGRSCCNMWSPRLGRAKQFSFNWPCNLPQLGWITGENSSLEREWGNWHTADHGLGGWRREGESEVAKSAARHCNNWLVFDWFLS